MKKQRLKHSAQNPRLQWSYVYIMVIMYQLMSTDFQLSFQKNITCICEFMYVEWVAAWNLAACFVNLSFSPLKELDKRWHYGGYYREMITNNEKNIPVTGALRLWGERNWYPQWAQNLIGWPSFLCSTFAPHSAQKFGCLSSAGLLNLFTCSSYVVRAITTTSAFEKQYGHVLDRVSFLLWGSTLPHRGLVQRSLT